MRTEKKAESCLRPAGALIYVLPMVPVFMLHTPALSLLPGMYGRFSAIDLGTIGFILMISRLFDGITDPLIGYYSDQIKRKTGSRKPLIILGAVLSAVGVYFWFRPGMDTGATYFLVSSILVYLGWTLIEIPHSAWMAELSRSYAERSRLSAYKVSGYRVGYVIFWVIPLLPLFATADVTPEVTAFISWIIIIMLALTITMCVVFTPDGPVVEQTDRIKVFKVISGFLKNRLLRYYLSIHVTAKIASGMVAGLYYFFVVTYLAVGDKLSHIGLSLAIVGLVSIPLWGKVVIKIGKHRAIAVSTIFTILTIIAMGNIHPGAYAFMAMLIVYSFSSILSAGADIGLLALMADVADYGELKTGRNEAGNYYSVLTLFEKVGVGIGGGASLAIAGLFSFNPEGDNSGLAMFGFYLAFLIIPGILYLVSAIAAWRFPLDERRHNIIVKRLKSRKLHKGKAN